MALATDVILVVASQGPDSHDARRISALTDGLATVRRFHTFDRAAKRRSAVRLLRELLRDRPALVVCEGTGIGAGGPLLLARAIGKVPYVISSGDAVGPFFGLRHALLAPFGLAYEVLLMRGSDGFIGWTPYLVGRALTLGAPRATTAPGWSGLGPVRRERSVVRDELGIGAQTTVIGIAGSLTWSPRRRYCYGLELVRAVRRVDGHDVAALIVGDGNGRHRLEAEADGDPRVIFVGHVPHDEVADYLGAMDLVSLPQSRDGVGNFRYTIKLAEYASFGVPVVTGRLPFSYDLPGLNIVTVPGRAPWDLDYAEGIAEILAGPRTPTAPPVGEQGTFDRAAQVERVTRFIGDLLQERRPGGARATA